MQRIRAGEVIALAVVVAAGATLRLWHLGTPSLWWDEIVQLSFAGGPDPWGVLRRVQIGNLPGSGNAGAMPLDYLVLHGWISWVPRPAIADLEAYYRFPSYVWSCATLVALWAFCRREFGAAVALAATLLLALSIPHLLYAAEARFYSLFMLMAVLNLAAFARVVRAPDAPGAWLAYGAVGVLFFLSGLLSLLVLPWQCAYLAWQALAAGDRRARHTRLVRLALTIVALAAALAAYHGRTLAGATGVRQVAESLQPWRLTREGFEFLLAHEPRRLALAIASAVAVPFVLRRRGHPMLPVVGVLLVVELVSIPLLVGVVRWKQYYFHPRHVLFLLPGLQVVLALGVHAVVGAMVGLMRPIRGTESGRVLRIAATALLALWFAWPRVTNFLREPHVYFARTKIDRDYGALVADLRPQVMRLAPGEVYVLIVGRAGPGYLSNPVLAWYLRKHRMHRRVRLLSADDQEGLGALLAWKCGGSCLGRRAESMARRLGLDDPFADRAASVRLFGLTLQPVRGTVGGIGAVIHPPLADGAALGAARVVGVYPGVLLMEPPP